MMTQVTVYENSPGDKLSVRFLCVRSEREIPQSDPNRKEIRTGKKVSLILYESFMGRKID